MLDIEMLMKFAPASVATAFASIVFPVPGGPKSNIPLQGYIQSNYNEVLHTWYEYHLLKNVFHLSFKATKKKIYQP